MAFNADMPPELITFDEQVVACEVEIDTFDDEVEYEAVEPEQEEDAPEEEEYEEEGQEEPGPSGYEYQYEDEEEDPNQVFLYDEDTSQIHQLNHSRNDTEEEDIDVVEYVDPSIPSTSEPSTSSSIPTTSSAPTRHFTTSVQGMPPAPPNTYYLRTGPNILKGRGREVQMPVYTPVTFRTSYTEEFTRHGKRVVKRTHAPLTTEEMETMMEDAQVMQKIQNEITLLKKANEEMKKTYEDVHKRDESISMVLAEAKLKLKDANEEKRRLQREVALMRSTNSQLVRKAPPGRLYQYPHRPH
ncbi:hypothetical protein CAEBREN_04107 [Caenorhabditis brenneri]|uniref:Uncharacterized protein n=1 Tax=Caenorhabditis brenneri TaxID=135651 RepID=G0NDN7_CAEBE|nr:hypothetical protein CAEBREN_04107 [Caenorhabditis brenneri]